jgi:hypothetical protein
MSLYLVSRKGQMLCNYNRDICIELCGFFYSSISRAFDACSGGSIWWGTVEDFHPEQHGSSTDWPEPCTASDALFQPLSQTAGVAYSLTWIRAIFRETTSVSTFKADCDAVRVDDVERGIAFERDGGIDYTVEAA